LLLTKVKFIHNPRAGFIQSPVLIHRIIERAIGDAPFEYDFKLTEYKGHATELAQKAAEENYDAVVVIGGDGTMNETARGLLHSNVAMGLIPLGSGNGLARGLDIPISIRRAARLLIEGQIKTIDAGKLEDRHFFVVAGLGFDALIGKLFDDVSLRGPLPYFTIGFREFLYYRPEVFILRFNGKQVAHPALLVAIANVKQWGNGAIIAPHAKPDDGLFDICVIHRVGFLPALYHLPKLFTGKIDKVRQYDWYKTESVEIVREKPGPFHVDGEPHEGEVVLHITMDHKALNVIIPKPKESAA
jgi:diacylglycerol kinase (ATP)